MMSCSKATQVGLALISSSRIPSVTFPLELLRPRVPYSGSFLDAVTLTLVILPSRGYPKEGPGQQSRYPRALWGSWIPWDRSSHTPGTKAAS